MWVTVLPFILAANVTVNDLNPHQAWQMHNPEYEYTYEVVLNMSLTNFTKESDNYCRTAAGNLKCRVKDHDTLTCYFDKRMRIINTSGRCTHEDLFYPEYELFGNDDPFEVRFSEDGIEDLIVSKRRTSESKLDKLKAVLDQLNIDIDYRDVIKSVEKKKHGFCEYKNEHSQWYIAKNDNSNEGKNFQLAVASSSNSYYPASPKSFYVPLEAGFRVKKVKLINKCPPTYIFGNQIRRKFNDSEVYVKTINSVRDITVSKNEFMSSTTSDAVMYTPTSRIMRIKQKLSVELKHIDHANFPLRKINNPARASMTAFSGLQKILRK